MTLWQAVALFLASVAGLILSCKYLRRSRTVRILCIIGCVLLMLACAVYIGLTLLFVDAVQNQPPV